MIGAMACPAWACDAVVRRVVVRERERAVIVETPVISVVTPIVATTAVQTTTIVTNFVPTYGAGYVAQQAVAPYIQPQVAAVATTYCPPAATVAPCPPAIMPVAQSLSSSDCTEILKTLRSMDARMSALEKGATAVPSTQPPTMPSVPPGASAPPKLPATFATRCASCHTEGKLDKDTTFTMFTAAGPMSPIDAGHLLGIARKVRAQKMPPPNNQKGVPVLTEAEAVEILDWIETGTIAVAGK